MFNPCLLELKVDLMLIRSVFCLFQSFFTFLSVYFPYSVLFIFLSDLFILNNLIHFTGLLCSHFIYFC